MNTQFIIILLLTIVKFGQFNNDKMCPNSKYCKCDWNMKLLKCQCNSKECQNETEFNFQNFSFVSFNEIQIKNIDTISSNFFNSSKFSREFRLKFHRPNRIESNAFNSTEIKHLEIVYTDIKLIDIDAFKNMKCEFLSLVSIDKNIDLNLNFFGHNTFIKALSIDFNFNSNQFKKLFYNKNFILNKFHNLSIDQLELYWSSKATIKNLFIKDVRGIETLDYSWAPRFESLDRIEITRSDIRVISKYFSMLHSRNLKYLTITKSRIETIESKIFENLNNLRMLDLSYNSIKYIELEAFYGLNSLKVLKLKSITSNNFIDDLDVCMLSFLPCNINVQLDEYDGSMFSCALIYLNEIKTDKSIDYIDLLKSLTVEEFNYKRDVECNLKKTLNKCFNLTNQANICAYKSIKLNIDHTLPTSTVGNTNQDELFALVELALNKPQTKSEITSSTASNKQSDQNDELFALVEVTLNKTVETKASDDDQKYKKIKQFKKNRITETTPAPASISTSISNIITTSLTKTTPYSSIFNLTTPSSSTLTTTTSIFFTTLTIINNISNTSFMVVNFTDYNSTNSFYTNQVVNLTEYSTTSSIPLHENTTSKQLLNISNFTIQNISSTTSVLNLLTNVIKGNPHEAFNQSTTREFNGSIHQTTSNIANTTISLINFSQNETRLNETVEINLMNSTNHSSDSYQNSTTIINQTVNEQLQNFFIFSQSSSSSNQSYNNLLVVFKISIALLIFLLFMMSVANLYLLYSNRLSKGGLSSNRVNTGNNPNDDKRISLKSFGFLRKSPLVFLRENSVGANSQN